VVLAGCDTGHQDDVSVGAGAGVHIVGTNVGATQPLIVGAPIEIAFDRLLNPLAVTRQTFVLQDLFGNFLVPTPSYDPVSRVVRLCMTNSPALLPDQSYELTILPSTGASAGAGFQAIDGAGLDPSVSPVIQFAVKAGAAYTGSDACSGATAVDFCSQVLPIFASKCGGSTCHGGSLPAAGLLMNTPQGIQATAVGRVAQGSNTGNASQSVPPAAVFGVDMPIITPGAPGASWLMYKVLLAEPPACSSTPGASCDAGAPGVVNNRYPEVTPAWSLLSDDERATLSNYVQGREMPYPADPSAPLDSSATSPLTGDELDTVSMWIQQGAGIPGAGCN
jgi:hypothetical protein